MMPTLIETESALADLCGQLSKSDRIGLDTEFLRERTYRPKLGLVQISDGRTHALVDPLAVRHLGPLFDLLQEPKILKILHAPREDLEIFYQLSGRVSAPVFDTQIAASFAGVGHSLSYQNLVRELIGDAVPKMQTRTDWLRRPLTNDQKQYAILDVLHLLPMQEILARRLDSAGRAGWVAEEFRTLETIAHDEDPMEYYRRVKQVWRLTRRQLAVLQRLCAWREEDALARDCLRQGVAPDDALVDLAKMQPAHVGELRTLNRLHPREVARSGDRIIEIIREAKRIPESEMPQPVTAPITDAALVTRAEFLGNAVRMRAMEMGISHEVLAKKRALEDLVKAWQDGAEDPFPESLSGWRRDVLGDYLIRLLEGRIAFRINPESTEPPLRTVDLDGRALE